MPSVAEKCLGSMRTGTRNAARELVLLYAEKEDAKGCEGLVADLTDKLSSKQPKVVAANVAALAALVTEFGGEQVHVRAVSKCIPVVFAHADKNVRAEGAQLAVQLHRWMGAALSPVLSQLKDIQVKELEAKFAEAPAPEQQPIRYLTSLKRQAEQQSREHGRSADMSDQDTDHTATYAHDGLNDDDHAAATAAGGAGSAAATTQSDPYDMAEPCHPLRSRHLTPQFFELVCAAKWQDRMNALESLYAALTESIRIWPDPGLDAYVQALQVRIQKDANINVVLQACKCIDALCRGLRQEGAAYMYVLPTLLEKLKERKPSTVDVLQSTLDAMYGCGPLSDILEPVSSAATHKNPAVKGGSVRFLGRCIAKSSTTSSPLQAADVKVIAALLVQLMSDGAGDVRDAAASSMGILLRVVGERPLLPYLDKLDEIKRAKVREEASGSAAAVVGAAVPISNGPSTASSKVPPATSAPRAAPVSQASAVPSKSMAPPRAPAKPPMAPTAPASKASAPLTRPPSTKGPPASKALPPRVKAGAAAPTAPTTAAAAAAPRGKGHAQRSAENESVRFRYAPEEAEARALELMPERIQAQLASSQWKERLEGAQALGPWLETEQPDAELVARFLTKRPGWKESNFQVMGEVIKHLQSMTMLPSFDRPAIALTVQPLSEKLGDMKLKGAAGETLCQYAEVTSLGFVLAQSLPYISGIKAPKAQADALAWIDQTLLAFGVQGIDMPGLVAFVSTCLKSANAAVRSSATAVVVTLARYVGPSLLRLLQDVNPQLMATLETQVQDVSPPPPPSRFPRAATNEVGASSAVGDLENDASTATHRGASAQSATAAEQEALEAMLPRVNVDTLVSPSMLAGMADAQWKVRKEAMEQVHAAIKPHVRLEGSGMELAQALKPRLHDTNLMVRTLALDIVTLLANGMQVLFEPLARVLGAPVTQVLADSKAPLRATAAATLTAMAQRQQLAPLLAPMGHVLDGKYANPMLKQDLYGWLHTYMTEHPGTPGDVQPLLPAVVASLDDRSAPVRKAAQLLLPFLVQYAGHRALYDAANQLKGASRATAVPLIDAARSEAARSVHAAGATASSSKASGAPAPSPSRPTSRAPAAPTTLAPQRPTGPPLSSSSPARVPTARRPMPRPVKTSAVSRSLSARRPTDTSAAESGSASAPAAAAHASSQPSIPFLTSDPKYKVAREKASRTPLVVDGSVRPHEVDVLRQQMEACCAPRLVGALFSQDHHAERDYLQGLQELQAFLTNATASATAQLSQEQVTAYVVAHTDLVIKYACVRLFDKNTSVALRCFELLHELMELLVAQSYHLQESETQALVASLIVRMGDPKAVFRDQARSILRQTTVLFPPSRVFLMLLDQGVPSKNARTRAESLGELAHLLSRHGLDVCTPSKALPAVAKCIGDRDASVRGGALHALSEAYKYLGDGIWRLVGPLPPKDEALLEERLKRTGTGPAPKLTSTPTQAAAPTPRKPSVGAAPASPTTSGPLDDLALIRSHDKETSIAGLKALQTQLASSALERRQLDVIVRALLLAWGRTANDSDAPATLDHRYVRHVLQSVLVLLDAQHGDVYLDGSLVAQLLDGLLRRLTAVSTAHDDEASETLSKQLNAVVLRILSTCEGDCVYEALFSLLASTTADLTPSSAEVAQQAELVVKCLWKVARKLPAALEAKQVHGEALLACVERFFQAVPPAEWGVRARQHVPLRDIPLITATNVLKQLTDTLGEGALALTDTWPEPESSHVYRYLLRLLHGSASARSGPASSRSSSRTGEVPAPDASASHGHGTELPAAPASSSMSKEHTGTVSSAEEALTEELRGIFDRISQKDQSRAAIRELYEFQKRHPSKQASIERSLQNTGPIFQRYIKRALANHAADDEAPPPSTPSTSVDARLAELKAKFRREPVESKAPDRVHKRMSMSTEALRTRLAAMRTDEPTQPPL